MSGTCCTHTVPAQCHLQLSWAFFGHDGCEPSSSNTQVPSPSRQGEHQRCGTGEGEGIQAEHIECELLLEHTEELVGAASRWCAPDARQEEGAEAGPTVFPAPPRIPSAGGMDGVEAVGEEAGSLLKRGHT